MTLVKVGWHDVHLTYLHQINFVAEHGHAPLPAACGLKIPFSEMRLRTGRGGVCAVCRTLAENMRAGIRHLSEDERERLGNAMAMAALGADR